MRDGAKGLKAGVSATFISAHAAIDVQLKYLRVAGFSLMAHIVLDLLEEVLSLSLSLSVRFSLVSSVKGPRGGHGCTDMVDWVECGG